MGAVAGIILFQPVERKPEFCAAVEVDMVHVDTRIDNINIDTGTECVDLSLKLITRQIKVGNIAAAEFDG